MTSIIYYQGWQIASRLRQLANSSSVTSSLETENISHLVKTIGPGIILLVVRSRVRCPSEKDAAGELIPQLILRYCPEHTESSIILSGCMRH